MGKKSERSFGNSETISLPNLFLTLSFADLSWNELVGIISKLNSLGFIKENVEGLNYFERCNILNSNAVLLARHFQHRVEIFFKEILIIRDGPLGIVKYYAIRAKFQFRGSKHIHSFLWALNAPTLAKTTINEYVEFLDSVVCGNLPSEEGDPHLYQLIKIFQIHCHSETCHKYKNSKCGLKFGRFFTHKTIIAIPLQHKLNQVGKFGILNKRNNIFGQVKKYIDNNLDLNSKGFSTDLSIHKNLSSMGITEDDYYRALSISPDNDYEINLKRSTGSCFVNNYNPVLLKAWEANLDIQPVHNYFKALTYMTGYFSKSESEVSGSLKQLQRK